MNLLLLLLLVLLSAGCGGMDPVAATPASVPTETPDFLGRGALGPGTEGLLEITADPDGDLRGKLTVEGEGGPSGLRAGSYELVGRQNVISGTFVLQNAQEGSAHMVVTGHARADVLLHRYAVLNDGQIFPGWLRQGVQGSPRPDVEPRPVTLSEVILEQLSPRQLDAQLDGSTESAPSVVSGGATLDIRIDPGTTPLPSGVTFDTTAQMFGVSVSRTGTTPDAQEQQNVALVSNFLQQEGAARAVGPENFLTVSEAVAAKGERVRFRQWAPRQGSEVIMTVTRSDETALELDLEAPQMDPDPSVSPNDAGISFSFKTHLTIPR